MEDLQQEIQRLHQQAGRGVEDRRAERWMRPGALVITLAESNRQLTVQFRDGSAGGIGFTSKQPLNPLTKFSVSVNHPRDGKILLRYEVVRCEQRRQDVFEVGAKLLR